MKFIELTTMNGAPIYLRADRIMAIESKSFAGGQHADIFVEQIDESSIFPVQQSAEEVLALVESLWLTDQ